MEINIVHLYPELLNLYGDKGNIASLMYRMEKRGIACIYTPCNLDEAVDFSKADIVVLGGGGDREEALVLDKLLKRKEELKDYIEKNGVMLALCGGFEMMGKYIEKNGEKKEALSLLDIYTLCIAERHIGNIVIESELIGDTIVGFENKSGLVFSDGSDPLGRVISGCGNDGKSGYEGVIYKNLIATHLHGPVLPKNPKLCDYLITKALNNKYSDVSLEALDDTIENEAHAWAVKKFS